MGVMAHILSQSCLFPSPSEKQILLINSLLLPQTVATMVKMNIAT